MWVQTRRGVVKIHFRSFAAFKRTVQKIDLSMFFFMLLGLDYVYFWVIISVTCGLVIQFTHVYGIVSVLHLSMCEK